MFDGEFGNGETVLSRGLAEKHIPQLKADIVAKRARGESPHNEIMFIHQMFAFPVACLTFGLLGLSLGLHTRREGKLAGLTLGLAVVFVYYGLRGLSLMVLPFTDFSIVALGIFAVFYGLDWIATVPPTVRLTGEAFGRENTGVIYGWIGASHQLGASLAALGAGAIRSTSGDYRMAFWIAAGLCVLAGMSFLTVGRRTFDREPPRGRLAPAV